MNIPLDDADYVLTDGAAWLTVGLFAVRVRKTDEGIACDIYADGRENDNAISSCWALDADIEEQQERKEK